MKDSPTTLRQVVYHVDEDEGTEPVKHPTKHRYSNNELATMIRDGFKDVNARIDRIEARLDYIVKANELKDLPKKKK